MTIKPGDYIEAGRRLGASLDRVGDGAVGVAETAEPEDGGYIVAWFWEEGNPVRRRVHSHDIIAASWSGWFPHEELLDHLWATAPAWWLEAQDLYGLED